MMCIDPTDVDRDVDLLDELLFSAEEVQSIIADIENEDSYVTVWDVRSRLIEVLVSLDKSLGEVATY